MRLYRIPFSTNVERVTLALAHKGLAYESVWIDPADRSEVLRLSGQELVPVLDLDGEVLCDSMRILARLEELRPEPALYPSAPARRAETEVFIDWFNRVWKVPPNAIAEELSRESADEARVEALAREMEAALDIFEPMLTGREHLMGESFGAADCCAFPFLRYALLHDPGDDELFHLVLRDRQPLGDSHPRLRDWIRRVERRPR